MSGLLHTLLPLSAVQKINVSYHGNLQNVNIAGDATTLGWDGYAPLFVTAIIDPACIIGSVYAGANYAFKVPNLPAGSNVTIYNYGIIVGAGGLGGNGAQDYVGGHQATVGGTGGHSFVTLSGSGVVTIYNYGTIVSGGGGGGGGGWGNVAGDYGGGGGGGAGWSGGIGGLGGPSGASGVMTTGGAGSAGTSAGAGKGGTGGAWGGTGSTGANGVTANLGAAGGAPGNAVTNNANITWIGGLGGTILGTVV